LEDFVGSKFYCPHALAGGNQLIRIREKTLEFSSTVLSTLSPYLQFVNSTVKININGSNLEAVNCFRQSTWHWSYIAYQQGIVVLTTKNVTTVSVIIHVDDAQHLTNHN